MATWELDRPVEVNREGNVIILGFRVVGLPISFAPSLNRSTINATIPTVLGTECRVGPVVGWRTNQSTGRLFFRERNFFEPAAAAVSLVQVLKDGSDWLVDVAVRLNESQFIAINAGADKIPSGTTDCYVQRVRAGLVILRPLEGSDPPEPSGDLSFADGIGNQSIRLAAEKIGRLPGWGSGTPTLRVHSDAQAERVRRTVSYPGAATISLPDWENLRSGTGQPVLLGDSGSMPDVRTKGVSGGNPYIRYVEDGVSTDQTRLALDAAAADLNIGPANVTLAVVAWTSQTTVAHLVGRWSGSANANRSWRIAYIPTTSPKPVVRVEFARNLFISRLDAPVDNLENRTLIVYRSSGGPNAVREIWINGELVMTGGTAGFGINNTANKWLTIGACASDNNDPPTTWTDFLDTSGSDTPTTEVPGSVDQVAIYTQRLTDGQLNLVFHEMARRATIDLGRPITQPNPASQAYGPDNPASERRLDRRPVALINLFGGVNYDEDPLGRVSDWYNADTAWLKEQVHKCLNGCDDYEILFNRVAGQYPGDIVSSGIFGDVRDQPGTPCVSTAQWASMEEAWDEFGISDHNVSGLNVWPPDERRRGWFYTGGGMSLDDDGNVTQNAGCKARIVTPLTPAFYRESVLDFWVAKDSRYRCLMLDSAVKFDGRFVQMVHSDEIREDFTLVGESISTDEAARSRAPWIGLAGVPSGPWWNGKQKINGYNSLWTTSWSATPVYCAVLRGDELDLTRTSTNPGDSNNLRFGDIYTFVRKGATPIAWGGQYAKVGAAWDYGTDRIPVGRFTMLSPRNARVWR